jgi:hypothetical protein
MGRRAAARRVRSYALLILDGQRGHQRPNGAPSSVQAAPSAVCHRASLLSKLGRSGDGVTVRTASNIAGGVK